MAPARQSTAQRNYSAVANGVSKATRWKIGRRNRRPRGLVNGGASCYRNGVLQTLLHLP
jgi:ubiquitin C-terminal hydrolase